MANGYNPQVAPTVLGSGTQPLTHLLQRRQREGLAEQRQQLLAQKQKVARDKNIATLMDIRPDKAWAPYDKDIKAGANKIRQWTLDQMRLHGDQVLNDPRFMAERARQIDEMNTIASGSERIKGVYNTTHEAFKDPKYNQSAAFGMLNDLAFNADRSPLGIDNTNLQAMQSLTSNPATFNKGYMAKTFVDGLGEKIDQHYTQKGVEGNRHFDITKIKRNALLAEDPQTGTWRVNVTPEVMAIAKNDPDMNALLEYHKEQTGLDDRGALTDLLKDYAGDVQRESRPGAKITEDTTGRKARETEALANARYEFAHDAFYKGDLTKLKSAADLIEGVDVEFGYPGGPLKPGIDPKPDRLLVTWNEFNVKNIPIAKTKSIDISTDEKKKQGMRIFNTLLNKKEVSGSRVGIDDWNAAEKRFNQGQGFQGPVYGSAKGGVYN